MESASSEIAPPHHILLVEDDSALLTGLADLLEMHNFSVTRAINGQEGLNQLRQLASPPDLIISDIYMPVMDGYEFLANVRENLEWLTIPFILLTAKGEKEDIREGILRGVEDYITKPFDFDDLLVRVQSRLSRRSQITQLANSRMDLLRRRILTILNHEFRTPLSYIVAYADLMANSPSFNHSDDLRTYISGILNGTERLNNLIDRFLTLAELESGTGATRYAQTSQVITALGPLIDEALENARRTTDMKYRDVPVTIQVERGLPPFQGSPDFLEIAIRHLIHNAIHFGQDNTPNSVRVNAYHTDNHVEVQVCDQGRGIPADQIPNLFDAFYQFDRDKHEQQGAGAGLAIVKHIATLHGGSIEVETQPDNGACFTLRIPIPK